MTMAKAMRRANGTGAVYNLGKRRRRPWVAMRTVGWEDVHDADGHPIYKIDVSGNKLPKRKPIKQIIGYYETKTEAESALSLNRISPISKKLDYTLKMLYDEWSKFKYTGDLSKDTINNYKAGWNYLTPLQYIRFVELRAGDYQQIIDLAAKDKSRSTLEKIKTLVVMLSEYAMQNDMIDKNYGGFIKLPKAERSSKKSFTHDELTKIENAAKDGVPFADCILMLCYSGWRITEFLNLRSVDVDLDKMIFTGGIKTDAGRDRTVPIHPKIAEYVKQWHAKNAETLICKDSGGKYTSKYFRENCYAPALTSIEGVRLLDPHECRHTFASLLHAAGVSHKTIMELMGHSDPEIDIKTYIHVDAQQLKNAIDSI